MRAQSKENGGATWEDGDPRIDALFDRKVVPQPSLATVKRSKRCTGLLWSEIGTSGIPHLGNEDDSAQEVVLVSGVCRKIRFDRSELRRPEAHSTIWADLETVGQSPRRCRRRCLGAK